ncbi:GIY-YIG nuclease family protein [Salmonella enterica subsp. enterica serovar 4,[5],12:i:-]|nr:GIY-YIG nuclease family protein [Salmonella enterica subsp. enterica serovar 4,[5],12:i:-]
MEIRFAHEFSNIKPRRLAGLIETESKVSVKCDELNYTFNGFVVDDCSPSDMLLSLTCNEHNETWNTTRAKRFLNESASGCTGCFAHKRAVGGKTTPKDKLLANAIKACEKFSLICNGIEESEYINQYSMIKVSCAECMQPLKSVRYDKLISRGRVCRECSHAKVIAEREQVKKDKEAERLANRIEHITDSVNERNAETGYILEGVEGDIFSKQFKIKQYCPEHKHRFAVTWDSFKGGTKGCKYCCTSAFRKDKPVNFYIQTLDDRYIKFGVTNRNVKRRMIEQQRESVFSHELVTSYRFVNGEYADKLERLIKKRFKCGVVNRRDMRDGYTETLPINELSKLITMTHEFVSVSKAEIVLKY